MFYYYKCGTHQDSLTGRISGQGVDCATWLITCPPISHLSFQTDIFLRAENHNNRKWLEYHQCTRNFGITCKIESKWVWISWKKSK